MTAAELAQVMRGFGRLEARLDQLEATVWESARKERVRVDRVVEAVVERMQAEDAEADVEGTDELAVQRGRRPR